MSEETNNEKIVFKAPPKMAFTMGILVGITLASLTAFIMTFSLLKADLTDDASNTANSQVAGAEVAVNTNTAPTPTPAPTPTVADIEVTSDDHIRGDVNAPVTLVEYSDFECSFCSRVKPTLDQVLEEFDGQVRLVFRHFPLSFHTNAQKAGEASECAGDQDKFWEMHDLLFENQSALDVASLKSYAVDLGLNASTFNDCLDNGTHATTVSSGLTEGSTYGVQGTPATFVNGTLVSGAQPFESFKAAIETALE